MTASWAIKLETHILKTGGKIPKGSSTPSSTQAERGAYLHLLLNIYTLASQLSLSHKVFQTYIDNKQVIDYSTLPTRGSGPTAFMIEDYDLLDGIRYYTELFHTHFQINLQQTHIYSHLDDRKKQEKIAQKHGEDLLQLHLNNNTARTFNQECDNGASKHYSDFTYLCTPAIPQQINILFHGKMHTSKKFHYLHDIHQEQTYKTYLKEKFHWTEQILHTIDWQAIEAYMKTLPTQKGTIYKASTQMETHPSQIIPNIKWRDSTTLMSSVRRRERG